MHYDLGFFADPDQRRHSGSRQDNYRRDILDLGVGPSEQGIVDGRDFRLCRTVLFASHYCFPPSQRRLMGTA